MSMSEKDFDNMSDEEIMNMSSYPDSDEFRVDDSDEKTPVLSNDDDSDELFTKSSNKTLEDELDSEPLNEDRVDQEDVEDGDEDEDTEVPSENETADEQESVKPDPDGSVGSDRESTASKSKAGVQDPHKDSGDDSGAASDDDSSSDSDKTVDYKAAYEHVMSSFKANGKDFTPESPEEAIRLMQMGANYTQKMQALKPNLKLMRMLENNNLLTEEKLTFLIDLDKKDPKAVQKLLHDGEIDPLDFDTTEEPEYRPGNHSVSDQEMNFHEAWEDVTSTPTGQETVKLINDRWDQASKDAVYREPVLLKIIDEQRSNGIYAKITAEVDRQKTLGNLVSTPFIEAYKLVGDQLHQSGALAPEGQQAPAGNPAPARGQVIATRTGTGRNKVDNNAKAKAASPSRSAPAHQKAPFDPFSMSDDEIMALESPRG